MSILAIIGAGTLGGSVARVTAAHDIYREVRLIDDAGDIAAGKALDIRQAGPIEGFGTALAADSNPSAAVGADLLILAGPAGGPRCRVGCGCRAGSAAPGGRLCSRRHRHLRGRRAARPRRTRGIRGRIRQAPAARLRPGGPPGRSARHRRARGRMRGLRGSPHRARCAPGTRRRAVEPGDGRRPCRSRRCSRRRGTGACARERRRCGRRVPTRSRRRPDGSRRPSSPAAAARPPVSSR